MFVLFQQWYQNEREIEEAHIRCRFQVALDEVIGNLPVSVLWSPDYHSNSVLCKYDINKLKQSDDFLDLRAIYVMMKAGDINDIRILRIFNCCIWVTREIDLFRLLEDFIRCKEWRTSLNYWELVSDRTLRSMKDMDHWFEFHIPKLGPEFTNVRKAIIFRCCYCTTFKKFLCGSQMVLRCLQHI